MIDVVGVLGGSDNPRNYWNMLKARELGNGVQLYTIYVQLKLESSDGNMYMTDCANREKFISKNFLACLWK